MEHPRRIVMEQPRRILLVGAPGCGKGRLAPIVARKLGLPIVRIEDERSKETRPQKANSHWLEHLTALAADEFWVMTGQEPEILEICVPRADWIVWLDMPLATCLRKTLQRLMRRETEKVCSANRGWGARWLSVRLAWRYPAMVVPAIVATIHRERRNRTIFILHSEPEVSQFIDKLPQARV